MLSELVGRLFSIGARSEFERYYGNVLLTHSQTGRPTLDEAKRDYLALVEINARIS